MEVATLTGGYQTDGRALPQLCPLASPAADKLRVVYETGWGVTPPVNIAEGRESLPASGVPAARLRYTRRPQGQGVLPPYGGMAVEGMDLRCYRSPCVYHASHSSHG
jgi:hypothetical protein